jgi:adenylate/nucleoside-diphosphate kinase
MDQDEEEEDADEDEEEDDDDSGDPFNRERKKIFGDAKFYCPVMLKERNVLWPGTVECAAKYRERTYFFSSVDARAQFLEDPESFLSPDAPIKVRQVLSTSRLFIPQGTRAVLKKCCLVWVGGGGGE